MAEPTRTQIQSIVDTKIISVAVDSDKTTGTGLQQIYTALLDVLYGTGIQPQQDILNLILDNIITGSLRGDVITGNGLVRHLTILTEAVFGDYPSIRQELEDQLYPYIRNVSNRTDTTAGQTIRDITGLILDKIYGYKVPENAQAEPVDNLTGTVLSSSTIQLNWSE